MYKGNTMMAHISGLITQDSGEVSFFRDIIEVHNSLQELIEESADGLDISENEKSLDTLLVVIVIIITVLYMLPYSIKLYIMTTQMENLKKEFGGIAIEEFSNKDANDEDDGKHRFLHLESKDTHIFWMNISFVIGLVPIIVSLLIGYFIAVGFIETETDITKSSAYVRTSFSTAWLGMIATLLQYVANDVDNNSTLSKEMQELKTAFVIQSRKESQKSILLSMKEFSGWLGVENKYIFNESELQQHSRLLADDRQARDPELTDGPRQHDLLPFDQRPRLDLLDDLARRRALLVQLALRQEQRHSVLQLCAL